MPHISSASPPAPKAPQRAPDAPLTVSVERAAAILGIGRSRVYELIADGTLESFKLGKRRLIRVAALERLVDQLAVPSRETAPSPEAA
jgi:excisionase family DNA binding protein